LREALALLLLLPPGEEDVGGLLRYHRMAKKPTRATARSCGMLIEVSVWAIVAVNCEAVVFGVVVSYAWCPDEFRFAGLWSEWWRPIERTQSDSWRTATVM